MMVDELLFIAWISNSVAGLHCCIYSLFVIKWLNLFPWDPDNQDGLDCQKDPFQQHFDVISQLLQNALLLQSSAH